MNAARGLGCTGYSDTSIVLVRDLDVGGGFAIRLCLWGDVLKWMGLTQSGFA